jgi:pectate lyase
MKCGRIINMMRYLATSILMFLVLTASDYVQAQTLAFPGAEGFGRFAKGGRGGQVIEVTNLNDSGIGSLRAALTAQGPRTVVFRVSGTIDLNNWIRIENPFLTIAGQTAPGDGVTIKGMLDFRTDDVVVRYIRVRPGPGSIPSPEVTDAIAVTYNSNNVILDHVSLSWASDEVASIWGPSDVNNITIQWSIIAESLHCPTPRHPEGCHGKGTLIGGGTTNASFHHNLLAHHVDRNPNLTSGNQDIVNNVIYNYGDIGTNLRGLWAVLSANVVGNYYLPGPDSPTKRTVRLYGGDSYTASSGVYVEGNIHPVYRPNNSLPETDIIYRGGGQPELPTAGSRFNFSQVTTTDAFQAKIDVLNKAGAILPVRDSVDARVVDDVRNLTGGIINMPSDVGGYPILSSGTPPADNDHDGMPDNWELANGFNPNDASDGLQDANGNGFTNLEEYLNGQDSGTGDSIPPS